MKKFEYKTETKYSMFGDDEIGSTEEENFLNYQGKDGWELVGVIGSTALKVNTVYYFKREIKDN